MLLDQDAATWQVKKSDGTTLQFPSLSLFRKWAVDGMVTVEDQISRNGKQWRYIVDIPELAGLIRQLDDNRKAQMPSPEQRKESDQVRTLTDTSLAGLGHTGAPVEPNTSDEKTAEPPPLPPPDDDEIAPKEISTEGNAETQAETKDDVAAETLGTAAENGADTEIDSTLKKDDMAEDSTETEATEDRHSTRSGEEVAPQSTETKEPAQTPVNGETSVQNSDMSGAGDDEPVLEDANLEDRGSDDDVVSTTEQPAPVEAQAQDEPESAIDTNAGAVENSDEAPPLPGNDDGTDSFLTDLETPADDFAKADQTPPAENAAEVEEREDQQPAQVVQEKAENEDSFDIVPPSTADAGEDDSENTTAEDLSIPSSASDAETDNASENTPSNTTETEMAELGTTMEIPMGASAAPPEFEYGDALKVEEKEAGQWDPNAMTMPNLSWGADAEQGGGSSAAPPPLDPEVHLQPVQSLTGSSPASDIADPPITADEVGNLGMNRYVKYGLLALTLVGLSAGAYYVSKAFLQSNQEPSAELPASAPAELTAEQPVEPLPEAKPEPPADAPIVFLVVDPQPRHEPIRIGKRTIELDAFLRPLTRAEKRQLAREEKSRQAKAKATAKLEAKQNRGPKKVVTTEKTAAPAVADLPVQPSEPPKPVGPTTYDEFMTEARKAQKAKKYRIAIEYLKAASAKNPKSVEPVAKLGWAYLGAGNATQAILKFSEAKRKNPAYRDTYVGLAKSLERAGRTDDAIAVYKQYLRMCPNCRKAKGVRASLMRLGAEL